MWIDSQCDCEVCSALRARLREVERIIHEDGVRTFSSKSRNGGLASMNANQIAVAEAEQKQRLEAVVREQINLRSRITRNDGLGRDNHKGLGE
jgi:queuine/archaeosine tRNA-ribosyltransferase